MGFTGTFASQFVKDYREVRIFFNPHIISLAITIASQILGQDVTNTCVDQSNNVLRNMVEYTREDVSSAEYTVIMR